MHSNRPIRLIGRQQLNPAEGDHSLIASMFDRLPKEVQGTGNLTRFVGYEGSGGGTDRLRFFGIEVEVIESIPEGLMAWDLSDSSWVLWQAKGGRDAILWQEDIRWHWLEALKSDSHRSIGEFSARGPAEGRPAAARGHRTFSVFAHVFFDRQKRTFQDDIRIVDYDSAWPEQYERMADWLRGRLGSDLVLRVEHYGSTAIPGMPAKPVIDILVEIPSFEEGKKRALPALANETWECWLYAGHMVFFKRKEVMGERTYHVHMAIQGHDIWKGLAFRDYLRSHPEEAARYAALKRRLAEVHRKDRERYTEMKTSFIDDVTDRALKGT